MAKAKITRKKKAKKQTNAERSQNGSTSIQKFDGHLPPILPELRWPDEIGPPVGSEARRRAELTYRAHSAAVYAHEDHFEPRRETLLSEPTKKLFRSQKELLLINFDGECHAVLSLLCGFLEIQKPVPPGKRISLLEDYQSWAKQLKELLREALFADEQESWKQDFVNLFQNYTPDDPAARKRFRHLVRKPVFSDYKYRLKFNDLFRAQMELEQRLSLMTTISLDWIAAIEARRRKKVKAKKRGHDVLEKQVGELLVRLKWPIDITAPAIKKILDTENAGIYRETSADSIGDTANWKKLQKKKQQHRKK